MLANQPDDPPIDVVQITALKTMIHRMFFEVIRGNESAMTSEGEIRREERMIFHTISDERPFKN